jgi:hypothetical protein
MDDVVTREINRYIRRCVQRRSDLREMPVYMGAVLKTLADGKGDREMSRICPDHKNYKGARTPGNPCLVCWQIYFERRCKEPVTGAEFAEFLDTLRDCLREREQKIEDGAIDAIVARLTADPSDW